jgi:GAF domain-containing protein
VTRAVYSMNQLRLDAMPLPTSPGELTAALKRFARSLVPERADFSFIHLCDKHHLRCVACAHATRAGRRVVGALARTHIAHTDPLSTVAQAVRSGKAQLRSTIVVDRDPVPRLRAHMLQHLLHARSVLVVPFVANGDALGALTLGYATSDRQYSAQDVPSAKKLARQITQLVRKAAPAGKPLARADVTTRRRPPLRARV